MGGFSDRPVIGAVRCNEEFFVSEGTGFLVRKDTVNHAGSMEGHPNEDIRRHPNGKLFLNIPIELLDIAKDFEAVNHLKLAFQGVTHLDIGHLLINMVL